MCNVLGFMYKGMSAQYENEDKKKKIKMKT